MTVLFVADRSPGTFVHTDYKILRSAYRTEWISFRWSLANIRRVLAGVRRADMVFGWFAGHHTFLPSLLARKLRKRLIIAASDYDLADEPWFDYGSMRGGIRACINNWIFRAADAVVVPSEFSRQLAIRNTLLRDMQEKVYKIPHGFDIPPVTNDQKQRLITTVGEVNSEYWIRKGHREFVQLATKLPDVQAFLVGRLADAQLAGSIRKKASPNLRLTDYVSDEELKSILGGTQVYAQLSYMEGFGCSVAEAMLAQCVPLVTRQGALPEVVGECGYYADYGDVEQAFYAVQRALVDSDTGWKARERVCDCFPIHRRRHELLTLVKNLN
jgi:glycosyltransferase involved in cell wall biosynthesis